MLVKGIYISSLRICDRFAEIRGVEIMFNIWVKLSIITMLLAVVIYIKGYIGFRNYQKVLDKTEDFGKKEMIDYMNLHIRRNTRYVLTGHILFTVSAVTFIIFYR